MSVIYIKRRAKYVLFYLWKFLLHLLFPSSHIIFCQRHVHQHREPEKSRKFMNQHGNWISCYLLPTPLLYTSDFWLVTVFVPFLEKRLPLSCYTAQKSICIKTFCGTCDLDHPISLLCLLVTALSFPWLFLFSDTSFILFELIPWAV